ncbi:hypothetical protein [Paraliomyxa miuraensis]|uniref:hypothetical protein n=1 Tax=Paraliomyxa miuraensis TaxID=376150 RepID=UPI00225C407E|nr:hypothetical protein [Paraliomyxa miuraensis]MCX4242037.1 hypothetical protein [Paraliomyxa miuraensis]
MPFYVASRLPHPSPQIDQVQRQAFAPRTVWLLNRPVVGRSMAFVDAEGQSIVTSRIQRILAGSSSVYVQTNNALYRLQHEPRSIDAEATGS